MNLHDVLVAGAGPAGSTLAALLAERGWDVLLVDRATFPRAKPCAEYLSPEANRVLDRLGVVERLDLAGAVRLNGMRVVSPRGTSFVGRFVAGHGYHGYRDHGLAVRREVLDTELVRAAERRGARLREGTTVEGLGSAERRWREVRLRCDGAAATVRARLVVGADGLNSRVARLLHLSRRGSRRRVALVTHATGVPAMTDLGEMHVGTRGYVGLAPVGHGLTNVAAVVDLNRVTPDGGPETWFRELTAELPEVAARLEEARRVTPLRAVGPFARWTRRATADRVLLVGDAADFHDPFTGEGVYAALRGAELAAEHAATALERDRLATGDLAAYDRARLRVFGGKWMFERLVSAAVAFPPLFERLASRLAARPDLADLLVGVSGDFVPPSRLLRPRHLLPLAF